MDSILLNALTNEQKDNYNKLMYTFGTPGWQLIKQHAKERKETALHKATFCSNWDENRQGLAASAVYRELEFMDEELPAMFETLAAQNVEEVSEEQELDEAVKFE